MKLPRINGYAAVYHVFGVKNGQNERIQLGAFRATLQERNNIYACINHLPALELGDTRRRSLSVWEDEYGLRFSLQPPENELGRQLVACIHSGAFRSLSFRAAHITRKHEPEWDCHTITGVEGLVEISFCDKPAYRETVCQLDSFPATVDFRYCAHRLHGMIADAEREQQARRRMRTARRVAVG